MAFAKGFRENEMQRKERAGSEVITGDIYLTGMTVVPEVKDQSSSKQDSILGQNHASGPNRSASWERAHRRFQVEKLRKDSPSTVSCWRDLSQETPDGVRG